MNKRIIIALCSLVVLIILLLLMFQSGTVGGKSEVYTDWSKEYDFKSKEPQDLALFKNLLQKHTHDSLYIVKEYDQLESIKGKDSCTFLFVSNELYLDTNVAVQLEGYVKKGANVFLSYETINKESYLRYFEGGGLSWEYSDKFYQWVGDTSLQYNSVYQNDTIYDSWYLFNENKIKDTNYRAYLFAVNKPTAFYSKMGKGKFHFHTNPRLFKNYQVISKNGFAHVSAILKYIPVNQPVVILEFAKPAKPEDNFGPDPNSDMERDDSYLQFIIQNDALRTAFFFIMGLIVVFIIFRTKRKENIIEGLTPKRNMSIAFVETLSSIYLSKNSPIGVLQLMRRNFYTQISRYFYIDLQRPEKREENIQRLIEKTGYPAESIQEIIKLLDPRKNDVDNNHLGLVYRKIDAFYKATGVRKDYDKVFIEGKKMEMYKSALIGGVAFLVASIIFMKGLQLLVLGGGLGIVIAIIGSVLLYFASRIIMLPVLTVNDTKMIKYNFIWGKTIINLSEDIAVTVNQNFTEFTTENNQSIKISHGILSKRSKYALGQIIEYIKRKTK